MKIKSRLFLCFAALFMLFALTSCSGLFAGGDADSGTGRIVLDLGGARAAAPEIAEYGVYLVPVSGNRTAYDYFLKMAMSLDMVGDEALPEGSFSQHGGSLSGSYTVRTGNWLVAVMAETVNHDYYIGYNTTTVVEKKTSSVTLEMSDFDEALLYGYALSFQDSIFFVATKATCTAGQNNCLNIIPDTNDFLNMALSMEEGASEESEEALLESIYGEEDTAFKLSNFRTSGGSLYADVIKVSYAGAPDSTFLSNALIANITQDGVQLVAGSTSYILFTGMGLFDYIDWLLDSYLDSILNSLMDPEILETLEDIEDMEEYEALLAQLMTSPEPISSPIIAGTPASLEAVSTALSTYVWDFGYDDDDESGPQGGNRIAADTNYASNFQDTKYVYYTTISGAVTEEQTYFWPRSAYYPYAYTDITSDPIELNFFWKLDNFRITDSKLYADVMKCYFDEKPAESVEAGVYVRRITNYGVIVTKPSDTNYERILLTANAGHVYIPTLPTNEAPDSSNQVDPYVIVDYFSEAGEDLDSVLTDIQGRLNSYTGNWPNGGQHQNIIQ